MGNTVQQPEPIQGAKIHISGLIRAREVPFETEEEWKYWWLGEFENGKMIRPPRMNEKEKETYTVAQEHNILVQGGITAVLSYLGYGSGTLVTPTNFSQYFALGNIPINQASLTSGDTSLAGEYFRAVPSLATVSGTQQDLSMFTSPAMAVGNITNGGLWGGSASATLGTGTLMTKSLFTYSKGASPVTFDYLLSYSGG